MSLDQGIMSEHCWTSGWYLLIDAVLWNGTHCLVTHWCLSLPTHWPSAMIVGSDWWSSSVVSSACDQEHAIDHTAFGWWDLFFGYPVSTLFCRSGYETPIIKSQRQDTHAQVADIMHTSMVADNEWAIRVIYAWFKHFLCFHDPCFLMGD